MAYSYGHAQNRAILPSYRDFENKVLRDIINGLWYVRKADLHRELKMEMVTAEIRLFARKHEEMLLHHDNVEGVQLLGSTELQRRLKKNKTI